MADNYLERRMEDLRAGRLRPSVPAHKRKGGCVLIIGKDWEKLEEAVKEYRRKGWRTAFTCSDRAAGYKLAQQTGARYCPTDDLSKTEDIIDSLAAHWRVERESIIKSL